MDIYTFHLNHVDDLHIRSIIICTFEYMSPPLNIKKIVKKKKKEENGYFTVKFYLNILVQQMHKSILPSQRTSIPFQ